MDILDKLTLDDLSGEQLELAECIGLEAYISLVRNYAGSPLNVPMPDTITMNLRNTEIKSKFNGYNFRELAKEYCLSEASIRRIVSDVVKEERSKPYENQCTFFDN